MTGTATPRTTARRAAVEREVLDAAWSVMAREGAAALSVREVARAVGLRQQSLTHYFPTKQALLDALFADGFADLGAVLDGCADACNRLVSELGCITSLTDYSYLRSISIS